MPGTLCNGVDTDQPYINRSRAYCQGFLYRLEGTENSRPKANNPYGTDQATAQADWNRGWDNCEARKGNTLTRADTGCCPGEGQTVAAA